MLMHTTAFNQVIENWDMSDVTDMSHMFYGATAFNQELGSWDTSNNVTDMNCNVLWSNSVQQQINKLIRCWDTSNVTNMSFECLMEQRPSTKISIFRHRIIIFKVAADMMLLLWLRVHQGFTWAFA
jgi:surface protein